MVQLLKGFVPKKYSDLKTWQRDKMLPYDEKVKIAANTHIRFNVRESSITYYFYNSDILTVFDSGLIIRSDKFTVTTKRRLNQFLAPFNAYVFSRKFAPMFQFNKDIPIELNGGYQNIYC
jgi:hypothetical protein